LKVEGVPGRAQVFTGYDAWLHPRGGFAQVIRNTPEIFKVFIVFIDPQDVAAG
jgi:hypothetical protein